MEKKVNESVSFWKLKNYNLQKTVVLKLLEYVEMKFNLFLKTRNKQERFSVKNVQLDSKIYLKHILK